MFDQYEECPQSSHGGTHAFVSGMMYVHEEDVISVASRREIECQECEKIIGPKDVQGSWPTTAL